MKIWFDALTGKQAILMHFLANKFEELGHQTLITSRPYSIDRANSNLDRLNRKHISIGAYGGATLLGKLKSSANRILDLADIIEMEKPDLLISFPSPDAFRTAFGLGIKALQINDTPHATAAGKLTISLSNALIFSTAINPKQFSELGISRFYQYQGVDEVLWIKNTTPNIEILEELNLIKNNFIVLRLEESKAEYFQRLFPSITPGSTILSKFTQKLQKINPQMKIVIFPRYPEQEDALQNLDVIIPEKSVDTISLLHFARMAMTGGGTMGREAALLGTPTLYSFPLELQVSTYISNLGFPLFHCPNHLEVFDQLFKIMKKPRMNEMLRIEQLNKLQTPFDGLKIALKDLGVEI